MATTTKKNGKTNGKAKKFKINLSPSVMKARATRHHVKASGKEYNSSFKAFQALKLPIGQHAKFRLKLKAEKHAVFTDGRRKIKFDLVETK